MFSLLDQVGESGSMVPFTRTAKSLELFSGVPSQCIVAGLAVVVAGLYGTYQDDDPIAAFAPDISVSEVTLPSVANDKGLWFWSPKVWPEKAMVPVDPTPSSWNR